MRILLHHAATIELEQAEDWYEGERAGLGEELSAEVDRALQIIGESPTNWPRWPNSPPAPVLRRFVLSRFPFALAYMVEPKRVIVLAIAHTRRRPGYWLHRLKQRS